MKLTKNQLSLYEKALKTLLFNDLYEFILSIWPEQIDTSKRKNVKYDRMTGEIIGLEKYEERNENLLWKLDIGNFLVQLDYCILITIHKNGLLNNIVNPREINKDYVQFLFEGEYIHYAVEADSPVGLRNSLNPIHDKELLKEYFIRNKT